MNINSVRTTKKYLGNIRNIHLQTSEGQFHISYDSFQIEHANIKVNGKIVAVGLPEGWNQKLLVDFPIGSVQATIAVRFRWFRYRSFKLWIGDELVYSDPAE